MRGDRRDRPHAAARRPIDRGICGSRRIADLAAHLVDSVLPDVPVRQWVLSMPHRIRLLCAYDPTACAVVRRVFVRAVSGLYLRRERRDELPNGYHVEYWRRLQELEYAWATGDARKQTGPDGIAMRFSALQKELHDAIRARWKDASKQDWVGQT